MSQTSLAIRSGRPHTLERVSERNPSANTRGEESRLAKRSNGWEAISTTRRMSRLFVLPLAMVALLVSAAALVPDVRAQRPQRFSGAELFFEPNDTDGDLGIHASIDGEH